MCGFYKQYDRGYARIENLEQSGQMILKLNGLQKVQAPFLELSKAKEIIEPYRIPKTKCYG